MNKAPSLAGPLSPGSEADFVCLGSVSVAICLGASPGDGLGAEWAAGLGTGQGWGCWGTWAWRMWGRSRTLDSHFNPLLQFNFQTAASLLCWWDYSPLPTPALSCVPLAMEELFQPV